MHAAHSSNSATQLSSMQCQWLFCKLLREISCKALGPSVVEAVEAGQEPIWAPFNGDALRDVGAQHGCLRLQISLSLRNIYFMCAACSVV